MNPCVRCTAYLIHNFIILALVYPSVPYPSSLVSFLANQANSSLYWSYSLSISGNLLTSTQFYIMKTKTILYLSIPFLMTHQVFGWGGWKLTSPSVDGNNDNAKFSLSFDYVYRHSDKIYRNKQRIANTTNAETTFHKFTISGAYRVKDNLSLQASLPYITAEKLETGVQDVHINGIGDLSLSLYWQAFQKKENWLKGFTFSTGITIPTCLLYTSPSPRDA